MSIGKTQYTVDLEKQQISSQTVTSTDTAILPDGLREVFVKNGGLFLREGKIPKVGSIYQTLSNLTLEPQLKGKLLLIHGWVVENVNPSATFKLGQALIRAGKYFDLLIIPGADHHLTPSTTAYVRKKTMDVFCRKFDLSSSRLEKTRVIARVFSIRIVQRATDACLD